VVGGTSGRRRLGWWRAAAELKIPGCWGGGSMATGPRRGSGAEAARPAEVKVARRWLGGVTVRRLAWRAVEGSGVGGGGTAGARGGEG